jgi:hypothetical protein
MYLIQHIIWYFICRCHWIEVGYMLHLCNEYDKGLDTFIDFVKKDMLDNVRGNLCYPCNHCKNKKKYRTDDVLRSHLIKHEFYTDRLLNCTVHMLVWTCAARNPEGDTL